jgi:phosphoglycolate phosphatase-like HAD superfamily hydrolase
MLEILNQFPDLNLKNISSVIWDFDGIHFERDNLPDGRFGYLCDESVAKVASVFLQIDFETSLTIAKNSIKKYDEYITGYRMHAKNSDFKDLEMDDIAKLHRAIYQHIFYNVNKSYSGLLSRRETKVLSAFDAIRNDVQHGIVSHASSSAWCKPAVAMLGLYPYFNENAVMGFEDYGYENKAKSNRGLMNCMDVLGADEKSTAYVDGRLENLKSAKNGFPDMVTVWRTPVQEEFNKKSRSVPEYVDIVIKKPIELLLRLSR